MAKEPKKILIRMPNWLGDLVMATSVFPILRQKFPSSSISLMCLNSFSLLFDHDNRIDQIIGFDKPQKLFSSETKQIINRIKFEAFDLGILMTNSFSSAWYFYKAGIPIRLGYKNFGRNWMLNHLINRPIDEKKQHLVKTYCQLFNNWKILNNKCFPTIFLENEEKEKIKNKFLTDKNFSDTKIIGIHPGSSYGEAKCWPIEHFRSLTKKILQKDEDKKIVFFGTKQQEDVVKKITNKFSSDRVVNLCGKTSISELACLIGNCDVFITNDSGPMHIASALQIPLIALFGSTFPTLTGPYNGGDILYKNINCSPCFKRTCPIDFRCMKRITPEEVYKHVQKHLEKTAVLCLKS